MRYLVWTLLLVSLAAPAGAAEPAVPIEQAVASPNKPGPVVEEISPTAWYVRGWGDDIAAAREEALQNARTRVVLPHLRDSQPRVEWQPTGQYVLEHLVKEIRNEGQVDLKPPAGLAHQVRLRVEVSPQDRRDIERADHEHRMGRRKAVVLQRQLWLAKLLAGLVAVLGAVAVYFRLDEATKGYYTAWLRVAAVGFLGGVGALLWLMV